MHSATPHGWQVYICLAALVCHDAFFLVRSALVVHSQFPVIVNGVQTMVPVTELSHEVQTAWDMCHHNQLGDDCIHQVAAEIIRHRGQAVIDQYLPVYSSIVHSGDGTGGPATFVNIYRTNRTGIEVASSFCTEQRSLYEKVVEDCVWAIGGDLQRGKDRTLNEMKGWENYWEWYPSHDDRVYFHIEGLTDPVCALSSPRPPSPISVNELVPPPFVLRNQRQNQDLRAASYSSMPAKEGSLPIPRIIHRIWVGSKPMPPEYHYYGETWKAHHPEWEHRLWTDSNLPTVLYAFDALQNTTDVRSRADIIRYYLLYEYGGVYVDADFECLKAIDPLLDGLESFASKQDPSTLNIAILGSVPRHPFFHKALYYLPQWMNLHKSRGAEHKTGPRYITFLYTHFPSELSLLPTQYFYPYHWGEVYRSEERSLQKFDSKWPSAYAVHHWGEVGFGKVYQRIMSGSSSHRWESFYRAGRYFLVPSCCMMLTTTQCVFTDIKPNETAYDAAQRLLGPGGLTLDSNERDYLERYFQVLLHFLEQQIVSFSHHRWQLKRLLESPRFASFLPPVQPVQLRILGGVRNDCYKLLDLASILDPHQKDTIVTTHRMFSFADVRDLQFYLGPPEAPTVKLEAMWINADVLEPYGIDCKNKDQLKKHEHTPTICLVDAFRRLREYMSPRGAVRIVLRDALRSYVKNEIPDGGTPNDVLKACGRFCGDVARSLERAGFSAVAIESKYLLQLDGNDASSFVISIEATLPKNTFWLKKMPPIGITGGGSFDYYDTAIGNAILHENVSSITFSSKLKDVVVINLDRRQDRWHAFLDRVHGLEVSLPEDFLMMMRRYSAVDGAMALRSSPRVANLLQHPVFDNDEDDSATEDIFHMRKRGHHALQHEMQRQQASRRLARYKFMDGLVPKNDVNFCGRTCWRTGYVHFTDGSFMPNGVLGCFLSHLNLWFDFVMAEKSGEEDASGSLDYIMVFEDDAELVSDFAVRWAKAENFLTNDPEWDIVLLGYGDDRDLYGDEMVFPGIYKFSGKPRSYGRGTHAYVLRKRAAARLLNQALVCGVQVPVDWFLIERFDMLVSYKFVDPPLADARQQYDFVDSR
jgi:mannosyltransferase OCH1-like enzyme/GR25 family glycosyltransferase involved in LPS biosynthesis